MIRNAIRKHCSTRLFAALAAVALIAAGRPAGATDGCGRVVIRGDGTTVTISGCVIDQCVIDGGVLAKDGLHVYCCVTRGSGSDEVTICDEVPQLIDLIVVATTTTTTLPAFSPRPFGAPSRFLSR